VDNPRKICLKALLRVEGEGGYSNLVLQSLLKDVHMDKRDVTLCSALFYGVIDRKITLDYILSRFSKVKLQKMDMGILQILRMGLYQMLFMDKIPPSAIVDESVKLSKKVSGGHFSGFVNGILRNILRNQQNITYPVPENTVEYLSIIYSCPQDLVSLWLKSYGREDTEAILADSLLPPPVTIRVNTTKTSGEEIVGLLEKENVTVQPAEDLPNAFYLSHTGAVEELTAYRNGFFHAQDVASQLCCQVLCPKNGETVADVCAAPGGKSFTMAQLVGETGKILSFDIHAHRVEQIKEGAARLGFKNITAKVRDAQKDTLSHKVDAMLVDVPCSGLGVIRRKPEIKYKPLENNLPDIQKAILENSAAYVKPGGRLVYSTCTLNPKENQEVVNAFLKEHPEWIPMPFTLLGTEYKEGQGTLMPHKHKTDGFFIALLQRN